MLRVERSKFWMSVGTLLLILLLPVSSSWTGEAVVVRDGGFSLELVALPLDAVDSFFLAREFPATAAREIAEHGCVHKLAAAYDRDAGEKAITVDLATWRVRPASGSWIPLALKETWAESWKKQNVPKPAQIAFRWALFPTQQTFHPGDRNWGMLPVGFAPGTLFDLNAVWQVGEKRSETTLTHLQCASLKTGP
ncbi:MAG: hypothetical protein H7839_17575 [Magnetococcus sp. YQC-5]